MIKLSKNDTVKYKGEHPYILANSQRIKSHGEEIVINRDTVAPKKYFEIVKKYEEPKKVVEKEDKTEEVREEAKKPAPKAKKTNNKK